MIKKSQVEKKEEKKEKKEVEVKSQYPVGYDPNIPENRQREFR